MRRFISAAILGAATLASTTAGIRADEEQAPYAHTIYAIVKQIKPAQLVVQNRNGRLITVDISVARQTHRTGVLSVDRPVALHGNYDALHAFHAVSITGAAGIRYSPAAWPQDE